MLKKFFISMLGSMAAIWLSFILLIIGLITVGTSLLVKSGGSKSMSDTKMLYLNLTGTIEECEAKASFTDILSLLDESTDDLQSILAAIETAGSDKNIKGIYINCGGASAGVASRSEIIDALKRFKATGKPIYAYADNYQQGDYYVASVADKVYLNPVGSLDVHGLASQTMFYKDVLDKLGIEVNVVRVGSFKSAVEPFLRMDMSEASRLQTNVFLGQMWRVMTETITENRELGDTKVVNMWADSLSMTWDPSRYVEQKAVNKLLYRHEVEKELRELLGVKADDELPLITPSEYLLTKGMDLNFDKKEHVAVLYAVGEISQDGESGIVAETLVPEIYRLAEDKYVKGLILRVNSPGGSAFASEQIWKALEDFKATKKPFYVSMGDYAASGGYYISCGADSIFCDPSTITGSIGIFGIIPNASKLIKDKIGLGIDEVETNPNATFPSLYQSPTASQLAAMQSYVERGYDTFTSRVAQGRDISVDSVKVIGGGRVWDGVSALKIGLVDHIGTLYDVRKSMLKKLGLKDDRYQSYPKLELSALETLIKQSKGNIEISIDGMTPEEAKELRETLRKIRSIDPVQARMENIVVK